VLPFHPDRFRCQYLIGRFHFIESISLPNSGGFYLAYWDYQHDTDPNPMFALRRHSSLSRILALPSPTNLQQAIKVAPRHMSSKTVTRLLQLHRQMEAPGSRTFSTDNATPSSTSGHMDNGTSSNTPTKVTETPERTAEEPKRPRHVDSGPPVLFKSEFAARIFVLNKPSALNALNHDMIKMIKSKIDVSCPQFAMWDYY
jgi:hypothetical protein